LGVRPKPVIACPTLVQVSVSRHRRNSPIRCLAADNGGVADAASGVGRGT